MKKINTFITTIFLLISVSHARASNTFELIKNIGFTPLNTDAIDFTLNNLQGDSVKLSSYKGRWIFLNFWATWCGPCQAEMPTLEGLKEELGADLITVIGVSIDQGDSLKIRQFIKKNSITFPILHDAKSDVANRYRASSVPSVYLISPDFRLVGILRGAINWEERSIINQVHKLVKIKNIKSDELPLVQSENPQELIPEKLLPPILNLTVPKGKLLVNTLIPLTITINWKGDPRKYIVRIPKIELPKGVLYKDISSNSTASAKQATLEYIYPTKFELSGKFRIGPVTLSYRSSGDTKEQFSRHPGIEINIVKKNYFKPLLLAVIVCTILLLLFLIFFLINRQKNSLNNISNSTGENFQKSFQNIKKIKLEGNSKKYLEELLKLNRMIILSRKGDSSQLDDLLEKISFGGELVTPQKTTYYEKQVEKLIYPELDE